MKIFAVLLKKWQKNVILGFVSYPPIELWWSWKSKISYLTSWVEATPQ